MRLYFTLTLLILSALLFSVTNTVKQDGTGDYTQIQSAIDASVDADTVLVYQGTYYENINYNGKNIVVASLYLTTQDSSYINTTIIDGSHNGSVVLFTNNETQNAVLCGFIIRNGTGNTDSYDKKVGGGIYIQECSPTIESCIIKDNEAFYGGGIVTLDIYNTGTCNPIFKSLVLKNNHAFYSGGGILIGTYCNPEFSQEYLSSIYLNSAGFVSDLYWVREQYAGNSTVYVDTFTVINPSSYYFYSKYDNVNINIQHAKIEQINHDLYVSPTGDNDNSGLNAENPLQSIWYAYTKIKSDSLYPNTIHLANGIYSSSQNNQFFPLSAKSYVSLIGENKDNTIIDIDDNYGFFFGYLYEKNYQIKNLYITANLTTNDRNEALGIGCPKNITLDSIHIDNYGGQLVWTILVANSVHNFQDSTKINIKNCIISNNYGGGIFIGGIDDAVIENTKVIHNLPYPDDEDGGIAVEMDGYSQYPLRFKTKLINVEISDCERIQTNYSNTLSAMVIFEMPQVFIINSTIANNHITGPANDSGGAVGTIRNDIGGAVVNIINSIITGNDPNDLNFGMTYSLPTIVNIENSLIGNMYMEDNIQVNNIGTNHFGEDPLFVNSGDYPFQLSELSPCIDAGVMDFPLDITLPETDLAGNPRVVNGVVDIGAYEYQGVSTHQNEIPMPVVSSLNVYPNPFMINSPRKTELKFELKLIKDGNIKLEIYNVKGQKVRTVMDAFASQGKYLSKWDGKNNQNKFIATGTYFARFAFNDKVMQVRKFIVVK